MDRMQNVVVCGDDKQGPSKVTCLLAQREYQKSYDCSHNNTG